MNPLSKPEPKTKSRFSMPRPSVYATVKYPWFRISSAIVSTFPGKGPLEDS